MTSLHTDETTHSNIPENNPHHNSSCWGEHPLDQKNSLRWQLQMPECSWQLNLSRPDCPSLPWEWRWNKQTLPPLQQASQRLFHLPLGLNPLTLQLLPKLPNQNLLWTLPEPLTLLPNQSLAYTYWLPLPLWVFPQLIDAKETIALDPIATHSIKPGVFWSNKPPCDRYIILAQHLEWREKVYANKSKSLDTELVKLDQGYVWTSVTINLHSKKITSAPHRLKRLLLPTTLMTLYRHRAEQDFMSDQLQIEIDLDRRLVCLKATAPEESAAQLSTVQRPWNFEQGQMELPLDLAVELTHSPDRP